MKRYIILKFICLLLILPQHACSADNGFQVKWVVDGDTVILDDGRKVRYIGINAPELAHDGRPAEPFAEEARRFNAALVYRKNVRLELDKENTDAYGRTLAYVFLRDGTSVNAEMLLSGHAYLLYYAQNQKHDSLLLKSQRAAMLAKKGFWKNWRENPRTFVGNRQSRRFHQPTCASGMRIKPQNRIVFQRQWDAYWEGYAPAKGCFPEFKIPRE